MEVKKPDYDEFLESGSGFGGEVTVEDFGVSREETRRLQRSVKLKAYVICPLCGLHRPVHKTGTFFLRELKRKAGKKGLSAETTERVITSAVMELRSGRFVSSRARIYNPEKETAFNKVNVEKEPFIVLKASRGKGGGFEEVYGIRIDEIEKKLSESDKEVVYKFIDEIEEQCNRVMSIIKRIRKRRMK
jgi:hypothetical protein